jgi:acyl-CoA synthetase (AMP-forming)/AMP-acid ligase II
MAFPDFAPCIPAFLRTLAERHGEREMIVHGERRLTYREAEAASARLARGLLAAGVGKGTRVALFLPNGPDFALTWLGAARIGALVIPINTFYQARELGWALRHCDAQLLLAVSHLLGHDVLERLERAAPELAGQRAGQLRLHSLPYLRSVLAWGGSNRPWASDGPAHLAELAEARPELDGDFLREVERCVTPADLLTVVYSSGSTGEPKGAIHTHGTLVRHSFNLLQFRDIRPGDRLYTPMPFFWVGGLLFSLLSCMHAGACLLCEDAFEPGRTLELLERERATGFWAWPHYAKAVADHPSLRQRDLRSLRAGNLQSLLSGAAPLAPGQRTGSLGMTETCGPHTYEDMEVDLPEKQRGAFGRAVPGLSHKVVDPATGAALGPGAPGEICVRGYSLMQGLYKREREDTFDADGYYHTGDAGYLDAEGWLFFQGRQGEMIKTGGANVTPREVELALEAQEEVKEAWVVGLPDPDRGQLVAAAVVLHPGRSLPPEELRARLRGELAAYKVPRHVFLYPSGVLPFTDSGKIDRRRLADLLAARLLESRSG